MSKTYGVLKLTVTSPVQTPTEPITLAEAKTFLRLPDFSPEDAAANSLIEGMIQGAREQAEVLQGKPLVSAQYDLTLDVFDREEIFLSDSLSSVDLVKYRNSAGDWTTLTANTDYITDTTRGYVMPPYDGSWPSFTAWPSSAVVVRFTVAPPAIPKIVKQGMLLLIAAWHENRLPFELGASAVQEYPFAVTSCLSHDALPRLA